MNEAKFLRAASRRAVLCAATGAVALAGAASAGAAEEAGPDAELLRLLAEMAAIKHEADGLSDQASHVQFADPKLTPPQETLLQHSAFFNFSKYYLGIHKTIAKDFEVNDAVLDEFKQFLAKEKITFSDTDMAANLDFVKNRIRIQLVGAIFGETEADRISISSDPLVLKSLESMPQAKELMAKAKRYVASKTSR